MNYNIYHSSSQAYTYQCLAEGKALEDLPDFLLESLARPNYSWKWI